MPMTEPERHELYELAKDHVSDRFADLMISAIPPDPSRLATKDDVHVLGSDLRAEMADLGGSLRAELADLGGSLRAEMADLDGALRAEMAELSASLRGEMAELGAALRVEMADLGGSLRLEMARMREELRSEMHELMVGQTRTLAFTLVLSITALCITQIVIATLG